MVIYHSLTRTGRLPLEGAKLLHLAFVTGRNGDVIARNFAGG
jgi:hypothetical protein